MVELLNIRRTALLIKNNTFESNPAQMTSSKGGAI